MINTKLIKTREDFDKYLSRTPYPTLIEDVFELVLAYNQKLNEAPEKITITSEQLRTMFKIKGETWGFDDMEGIGGDALRLETRVETRGRKKTILTEEDKAAQLERKREYARNYYRQNKGDIMIEPKE